MRTIRSTYKFKRDHKRETSGNSTRYCNKLDAELREQALIAAIVGDRVLPRDFVTSNSNGTLTVLLPARWLMAATGGIVLVFSPLAPARSGVAGQSSRSR